MCTVTFIPTRKGVYLTSNRDESRSRGLALPPTLYTANAGRLIYPRDPDAGGSWIAAKENGDAAVLLNGAFKKHESAPRYRKSRGLLFLEILLQQDPYGQFKQIDLNGIEPFTMVILAGRQLWECRWDGLDRHTVLLDATKPHIWSSATLYSEAAARERRLCFFDWLASVGPPDAAKIIGFHRNNIKSDRNGNHGIRTVSITSLSIKAHPCRVDYLDLETGLETTTSFLGSSSTEKEGRLNQIYCRLKKMKIRITNWEYWPAHIIYGPVYLYWCWLSLKAQSWFFFSAANPGIQYSGFVQERKSDIYKLIPQQYYPRTTLCEPAESFPVMLQFLKSNGFSFPLIAKPDTGEKGMQVKLLQSEASLKDYIYRSRVDFLIQEFIPYSQEAGIFYYRIPGESRGHISGIVGKEFPAVTGDGTSTVGALMKREDRLLLQLPGLKHSCPELLDRVLPEGTRHIVLPYGNHSRGAKFIDLKDRITDELTQRMDEVCNQIPGFFYGRLDIKFDSWEELTKGRNFSIIEINGAGSEPTHMYDPEHSLFYAWKEICRHWRILYRISRLNARQLEIALMSTADGLSMLRNHFRYLRKIAPE